MVRREGPLDVKIGDSKNWIKKFVKITDNAVEMYNSDKVGKPIEYMLARLIGLEVEEDGKRFGFDHGDDGRVRMRVKTPGESKMWVDDIKKAMQALGFDDGEGEFEEAEEGEEEEPEIDEVVEPEEAESVKPDRSHVGKNSKKKLIGDDVKDKIRSRLKAAAYVGTEGMDLDALMTRIDKDGTGQLQYFEFLNAVRKTFKISKDDVKDSDVYAIFQYLDADEEGSLSIAELRKFIGKDLARNRKSYDDLLEEFGTESAVTQKKVSSAKTLPRRAKKLDNQDREKLRSRLKGAMVGFGGPARFVALIDKDKTGYIEYEELLSAVRTKLKCAKDVITDEEALGLCHEVDQDNSGTIGTQELLEWIGEDRGREGRKQRKENIAPQVNRGRRESIKSKMDKVMTSLRGRIRVVTQNGKAELVDRFYRDADSNGDGHIDLDEFMDVIRKQLSMTKMDMSDKVIKELFSVLDEDDSGEVDLAEFTQFITNPAYWGHSANQGTSSRLQDLYSAHERKQQKIALLKRQREEEESRKLEESKARAKAAGSKKYIMDRKPRDLHHLFDEFKEREAALQERQRRYAMERDRQLQESKYKNLPTKFTRSASVGSAMEAGNRLYLDSERRARDRQQARDDYELAEYERFRTPRSASARPNFEKLHEEWKNRTKRMEDRRQQAADFENKLSFQNSVHRKCWEEGRSVDQEHLEKLHKDYQDKQQKLAKMVATQRMREERLLNDVIGSNNNTPRERPSVCLNVKSPRFPRNPDEHEAAARIVAEEKAKREKEKKAMMEAARGKTFKPLTTQADSALAAITKAIQFRCGFYVDADNIWDSNHRELAQPLEAVMKVYREALKNCEASEGYSALRSRASQRLFQEHLMPEFEGWARCIEPDQIRQVEDRLEDLMVSARKAQLELKKAIAGCPWPESREVTVSIVLAEMLRENQEEALRSAIAAECGRGVEFHNVSIYCSSKSDPSLNVTIQIDLRKGGSAHATQNQLAAALTPARCGGACAIEARVSKVLGTDGFKISKFSQPQIQGAVRAHPDGVPIALFAYDAGVKPQEKAEAKALVRYGPAEGPRRFMHLVDLSRLLLVFSSCDMLQAGLDQILRRFEVVDVRNYFSTPGRLGFRFVEVLVIVHIESNGERIPHVCELRLEELCFHQATAKAAEPLKQLYAGFTRHYTRTGHDKDAIVHLVHTVLMKPPPSHDLRVFRCHLAKRFGSPVCVWRRVLGGSRVLGFHRFRDVCQQLSCGEHATEFWQGLDPTLAGCISLFDLDPEATALLIKLRSRVLALADVSPDKDVDPESLFARLSFIVVRPQRLGHLEQHEFRIVAKPLGLTQDEADRAFSYLDYYGGSHHKPPATITVQDIAWLHKLPLRRRPDGKLDGLIDVQAVTMSGQDAQDHTETLRQLTWARASARNNKRGEILRWSVFKDGDAERGIARGSSVSEDGHDMEAQDPYNDFDGARSERSRTPEPMMTRSTPRNAETRGDHDVGRSTTPEPPMTVAASRTSTQGSIGVGADTAPATHMAAGRPPSQGDFPGSANRGHASLRTVSGHSRQSSDRGSADYGVQSLRTVSGHSRQSSDRGSADYGVQSLKTVSGHSRQSSDADWGPPSRPTSIHVQSDEDDELSRASAWPGASGNARGPRTSLSQAMARRSGGLPMSPALGAEARRSAGLPMSSALGAARHDSEDLNLLPPTPGGASAFAETDATGAYDEEEFEEEQPTVDEECAPSEDEESF